MFSLRFMRLEPVEIKFYGLVNSLHASQAQKRVGWLVDWLIGSLVHWLIGRQSCPDYLGFLGKLEPPNFGVFV